MTAVGAPSELLLFVSGRTEQADVELDGDKEALARLAEAGLGT